MSKFTQREIGGLYELTDTARAGLSESKYYNDDLASTPIMTRTWSTYHIGLSLAASLIPPFGKVQSAPFIGFFIFLFLTWFITVLGSESTKYLEIIVSPILVVLTVILYHQKKNIDVLGLFLGQKGRYCISGLEYER